MRSLLLLLASYLCRVQTFGLTSHAAAGYSLTGGQDANIGHEKIAAPSDLLELLWRLDLLHSSMGAPNIIQCTCSEGRLLTILH